MTRPRLRIISPAAAGLLFTLIFVPGTAAPQPASAPELDLQGFEAQLDRCAASLLRLQQNPSEIGSFRHSLAAEWDVRAGQQTFRVSTAWLDAALASIAAKPKTAAATWPALENHLALLREQARAWAAATAPPPIALARQKLDAIFRQREFRGLAGPGPLDTWWHRIVASINRGIAWILAQLHLGFLSSNAVAYILIAIALIFLAYCGWLTLHHRMRQAERAAEDDRPRIERKNWAADALVAAERGQFRGAIRCAYWAAVIRLEDVKALPPDRSCTPRELLNSLAPGSGEREAFRELTHTFELVWYGQRPPSPADWEGMKFQLERIGCLGVSIAPTAGS